MALSFLTGIDLNRNELQNARIQALGTAPTSPINGLIYYNTTTNRFMGYANGWVDLGTPDEVVVGLDSGKGAATGSKRLYIATDTKKIWLDNASGSWIQVGGQDTIAWGNVTGRPSVFNPPIATTTRLGGIKVGANLSITADGTLSASANPENFIVKEQRFIATEGQKDFVLTNGTYNIGVGALEVFLNGVKIESNIITETGTNKFSLKLPLNAGDILLARYIQLINVEPYPVHSSEHLPNGADPIPLVTTTGAGLMGSADKRKLNDTYTKAETTSAISTAVNGLINGAPGALDTLKELATAMGNDPNFATTITNTLANKVDKVSGKGLSANDFTTALLTKLNGIEAGANKYTHPSTHSAGMIAQDATHRFVTDSEKSTWNARTKKHVSNIGDGTKTTFTITHNLGTQDVDVTVRETASPYNIVYCDCQITSVNAVTLLFSTAPTTNQYRAVVVG